MEKILVVEDDIAIRDLIAINLEIVGYTVITTGDGISAKKIIEEDDVDLILLDVMIPKMDGFTLITKLQDKKIPIIFVTAKESVLDRVRGLRLGAVDYIIKPFETIELLARIEVALRKYKQVDSIIKFKHLEIYPEQRIVRINQKEIELTLKEYDLLMLFLKNKNIALSRDQILERVWGYDYIGETRTIDIHVQRLRDKLNIKDYIKTIFKIGYRLED
ncbi:response regulator transcription factor [Clostridium intestinale]|uniref:Stage 0 sporulation protein A homolog n=1 Tax=Clostridium intestinale URNW TaxID=1294142 RepID=U2NJB6_9CLOT|nr:response regulator transcription factor [Clostridium intestinale]ERK28956.1 putative two component response regulator transcriptional regulatory protein [Clostridium intestinale URNW]